MTQLYCRDQVVLGFHEDGQDVPASAYGEGVRIIHVASVDELERYGNLPDGWVPGQPDPRPMATPAPTPDRLKAYAASCRYQVETGGVTVGAALIATDRSSQAMITSAAVAAQTMPEFRTRWKSRDGQFVDLDAQGMMLMAQEVAAHVASCFAKEADVIARIESRRITSYDQVDAVFAA